jgi:hypothetical protein
LARILNAWIASFLEFPGFGRMKYPVSLITTHDLRKAVKELA